MAEIKSATSLLQQQQKQKPKKKKKPKTLKQKNKDFEKKRTKQRFKNEQQKEAFEKHTEKEFLQVEKANFFNYLLELVNEYDKQTNGKFRNKRQAVEQAFNDYENKKQLIDEIIEDITKQNADINKSAIKDLQLYYLKNYENTLKSVLDVRGYKYQDTAKKLAKNSIIGFLIGRYFSTIVVAAVIAFFLLLKAING